MIKCDKATDYQNTCLHHFFRGENHRDSSGVCLMWRSIT